MRVAPETRAQSILLENNITSPAVKVEPIAKKYGITINKTDLPENISGMLHKPSATIFVNQIHPKNRRRFTIAHELGHYFLSSISGVHVDKQIGLVFRDENSKEAIFAEEIAANRFAAELLMPSDMVKNEIDKMDKSNLSVEDMIQNIADLFEVSSIAMTYKLKNLGLIF
jgi:Zn-dependent peptidase ImmA (M78 family)